MADNEWKKTAKTWVTSLPDKIGEWLFDRRWFFVFLVGLYMAAGLIYLAIWLKVKDVITIPLGITAVRVQTHDLWLAIVVLYTIFSIRYRHLPSTKVATKLILGRESYDVKPGLMFLPLWLTWLVPFPRNLIEVNIGTGPKDDDEKEGKDTEKKSEPKTQLVVTSTQSTILVSITEDFRVTFFGLEQLGEERKNILSKRGYTPTVDDELSKIVTCDPKLMFIIRIVAPTRFFERIGDDYIEAVQKMRKIMQSELQGYAARHPVGFAQLHKAEAEMWIQRAVEALIGDDNAAESTRKDADKFTEPDRANEKEKLHELANKMESEPSWGVDLVNVSITDFGLPRRLNEAIANTRSAGFERQKREELAKAVIKEKAAEGQGQAAGVEALAGQLGTKEGRLAVQMLTTANTIGPTDKTIFVDPSNPVGNLLSSAVVLGDQIRNRRRRPDNDQGRGRNRGNRGQGQNPGQGQGGGAPVNPPGKGGKT